ncbi:MAG: helix-turn-helix domain-containing protein [Synergistales bacterium]|nr:helix-turn-helix domain-containing protein [Synergistales bacterium]
MAKKQEKQPSQIRDLRKALGLNQGELAKLLGVSIITIGKWEKGGGQVSRGSGPAVLKALRGILKQASRPDSFIDLGRLRKYLKVAAKKDLLRYYTQFSDELDGEYLESINSGLLVGVLMGMLYDLQLEKEGKIAPGKVMVEGEQTEETRFETMSTEDLLNQLTM